MTASAFTPPFPSARATAWAKLRGLAQPEVLILGGGVNGIGLLRDLALNGVSAVLIDEGDFCTGASSASSRMAHGGLRYLEGREFRLVAEAARERNMLLHDAGHLVKPLEIVVPLRSWFQGLPQTALRFCGLSRRAGPLSLAALQGALMLYERFGAVRRALPRHGVRLARAGFPAGTPAAVRAVVSYYDGQITGPEALALEMLGAATEADNVTALNHVGWAVEGRAITVTDPETGAQATLAPRVVVNATGAAIDGVNARLGLRTALVRGVKGAHLVLRHDALHSRMAGRAFYFDDGSGRMVICLPVADIILLGTTEVETADPSDHAVAGDEVAYLLGAINRLFDDIAVGPEHIAAVTSGIRPLQASGGNATQAARDHALLRHDWGPVPVLSLVGGKWTTFRSFAEQAGDAVLGLLGRPRAATTAGRPYPGAAGPEAAAASARAAVGGARAEVLLRRYGAIAAEVARFCAAGADADLISAPGFSRREVVWLIRQRMALTLEDMILRRTGLVMTGRLTEAALREIALVMAEELGHPSDWAERQVDAAARDPRILWRQ